MAGCSSWPAGHVCRARGGRVRGQGPVSWCVRARATAEGLDAGAAQGGRNGGDSAWREGKAEARPWAVRARCEARPWRGLGDGEEGARAASSARRGPRQNKEGRRLRTAFMLGAVTTWPRRTSSGLPVFVADGDMVDRATGFSRYEA